MGTRHLRLSRPRLRGARHGSSDLLHTVRLAGRVVHCAEDHHSPPAGWADARQGARGGSAHLDVHLRGDGLTMGALRGDAVRSAGGLGELRHSTDSI